MMCECVCVVVVFFCFVLFVCFLFVCFFFFFNDTATTEIYTLSLHDALPISSQKGYWLRVFVTCESVLEVKCSISLRRLLVPLSRWCGGDFILA